MEVVQSKNRIIHDPIYGFIHLTPIEWEIIHSPFYQRLRWIKQLGFSCYVFPGAEHSRFGHSIGVMFNAHKIIQRIGLAVSDEELMNPPHHSKEAGFHQMVRLAALMHDLGTFAFSHTTEGAYINFGHHQNKKEGKGRSDDHEHLGAFIIKNTDYEGGITFILKKYNLDPQTVANLVKGKDPSVIANQILHAEIDCDRMDYLLRDAHYTGLKYGQYDREYLLHHFKMCTVAGHRILTIKHNAIHCVEDFLMARFAWYSQVIRSARGAKFDALAEELCYYMLEKEKMYRYNDLLEMIEKDPVRFYGFHDGYFMNTIHQMYMNHEFDKNIKMKDIAECLLFEKSPRVVKVEELDQRLLSQDDETQTEKVKKRSLDKIQQMKDLMKKKGDERCWMVVDLPNKDISFVKSQKQVIKDIQGENVFLERDPVKISYDDGDIKLLADVQDSVIFKLQNTFNYVPNVYCSEAMYALLVEEGIVK